MGMDYAEDLRGIEELEREKIEYRNNKSAFEAAVPGITYEEFLAKK